MARKQQSEQKQPETKSMGSYYEVVDFANDPIMSLVRMHVQAGLNAYQNDPSGNADTAIRKYLFMLRQAETLLGVKFGFDFAKFRKELQENEELSDAERLTKEVKMFATLLENRVRKIEIVFHFAKSDVIDFARDLIQQDKEADKIDEELSGDDEEVVIREEEVLDTLNENEDVSVDTE